MYVRESILARLLQLAEGVPNIAAAARNVTDVAGLKRPAIAIKDGPEQLLVSPRNERRTAITMMQASPAITIYVGAGARDQGQLSNTFLERYLKAVLTDDTLLTLVTTNGEIRYEGASLEDPEPEGREGRMELSLVFVYPFLVSAPWARQRPVVRRASPSTEARHAELARAEYQQSRDLQSKRQLPGRRHVGLSPSGQCAQCRAFL
jgi:hypothetical protein